MALGIVSQSILFVILFLMGLYSILAFWFQYNVYRGRGMKNPDGTVDSWKEQNIFFGAAIADMMIAVPATLIGIALVFIRLHIGIHILSMVSFWFIWANIMTTFTSLKFAKPKITMEWLIVFPSGIVIGAAFVMWLVFNFNAIFFV